MKNELVLDTLEVQELSSNEVKEVDGGNIPLRYRIIMYVVDEVIKGYKDAKAAGCV